MKTIWKYEIKLEEIEDRIKLSIPKDSIILSAKNQRGNLVFFVLVDHMYRDRFEDRTILVAGTGHNRIDIKHENYIDTILFLDGTFVLHVFEANE